MIVEREPESPPVPLTRSRFGPRGNMIPFLLLLPALVFLMVFFAVPLWALLVYSFYRAEPGGTMIPAFTLENYHRFLTSSVDLRVFWHTVELGLNVTIWCLVLGFPLAYTLARNRNRRLRGVLITALLVPLMTSVVVRAYGWTILLAGNGLVNTALLNLGAIKQPLALLYTARGTTIALVEILLPYMVLSLFPAIQHIDQNLEQAAQSLGANSWRTFVDIILPLSRSGVASGSIIVFSLSIAAYAPPALVGGAKLLVMSLFVYQQALVLFNWPFGAAVSFILLVMILWLTFLHVRYFERQKWEPTR